MTGSLDLVSGTWQWLTRWSGPRRPMLCTGGSLWLWEPVDFFHQLPKAWAIFSILTLFSCCAFSHGGLSLDFPYPPGLHFCLLPELQVLLSSYYWTYQLRNTLAPKPNIFWDKLLTLFTKSDLLYFWQHHHYFLKPIRQNWAFSFRWYGLSYCWPEDAAHILSQDLK